MILQIQKKTQISTEVFCIALPELMETQEGTKKNVGLKLLHRTPQWRSVVKIVHLSFVFVKLFLDKLSIQGFQNHIAIRDKIIYR
jgi:hypothetical protein